MDPLPWYVCMPQHTKRLVINQSFLQRALFYHVCNRSLCIISVKAQMAEEQEFLYLNYFWVILGERAGWARGAAATPSPHPISEMFEFFRAKVLVRKHYNSSQGQDSRPASLAFVLSKRCGNPQAGCYFHQESNDKRMKAKNDQDRNLPRLLFLWRL